MRSIHLVPAALLVASAAAQGTYFVDAQTGDDSQDGLTQATAWRTLTKASQSVTFEAFIRVRPGVYDTALGESFPIVFEGPKDIRCQGATIVAPASATALVLDSPHTGVGFTQSYLLGLNVTGADVGLSIEGSGQVVSDCRFDGCETGLSVSGPSSTFDGETTFYRLTFEDCTQGVNATGSIPLFAEDLSFQACTSALRLDLSGIGAFLGQRFEARNCDVGIEVEGLGRYQTLGFSLERALISGCDTAVTIQDSPTDPFVGFGRNWTLVDNQVGLQLDPAMSGGLSLGFSILDRNVVDSLHGISHLRLADSFVPSMTLSGAGVEATDPEFTDPASGNYQLRRGSPAIDRRGAGNPIDGNLDTEARGDYGAFEYQTLRETGSATVGSNATFEVDGQAGGLGRAFVIPARLTGPGVVTPYGHFRMNFARSLPVIRLQFPASSETTTLTIPIPNDPALAGTQWSTQALIQSPGSPTGAAFSNALSFKIQ